MDSLFASRNIRGALGNLASSPNSATAACALHASSNAESRGTLSDILTHISATRKADSAANTMQPHYAAASTPSSGPSALAAVTQHLTRLDKTAEPLPRSVQPDAEQAARRADHVRALLWSSFAQPAGVAQLGSEPLGRRRPP